MGKEVVFVLSVLLISIALASFASAYETYEITESQFESGYTQNLFPGDKITFPFDEENKHITVLSVLQNMIQVSVSENEAKYLAINNDIYEEEAKFELNYDTYYDLYVKLNSVEGNTTQNRSASVTIKKIHDIVPSGTDLPYSCQKYYTCEDGTRVEYCEIQSGTNSAGCICEQNPASKCLNQTIGGNNTCTEDDNCNSGYECEDGKCVLEDEDDDDDNETEDGCEWQCSKWSECLNGTQTRTCTNVNNCTGETPKQSKTCKKGKNEKVCCKVTETEDNEIEIEYKYENKNECVSEEDEVKEIVNMSFCKGRVKQEIKFEERTGQECADGCFCRGVVMTCDLEEGKTMTIYAGSGNIIVIQFGGVNVSTNVTLYKVNDSIIGNFTRGEKRIIFPDEARERIKEKVKTRFEGDDNLTLNEDGFYEVEGEKRARLFWIFSVREHVRAEMNAENGDVKVRNPWWGFLANDREDD